ncbi:Long-chain fatty acid transport protein 4 (FATP-4) (Fatty acid transport protein 4) (Arachidonate--CoA ligase) (Long-chain-fatty-acid--CoA ligase) (Solute carrier family 27 member 4) (Very long-chain acyl-CoA synthetase 4) (ACSVL4) [Durusdinium trenchii]|uniref:Uncharacterized protein n=1 Tax=Durusdinium trenchii TaxID=1381693 RepID=A0ABP0JGZ7_9DINO
MALGAAALTGVGALVVKNLDEKYFLLKDARLLFGLTKLGAEVQINMFKNWTLADGVEDAAMTHNDKAAIVFEDEVYSFREWDERANQAARYFRRMGLKQGDVVALYMENRPEFVIAWAGMAKLGVVGALINNNLRNKGLRHCIDVSGATHVLLGAECAANFEESVEELKGAGYQLHVEGPGAEAVAWADTTTQRFEGFSKAETPKSWRSKRRFDDPALLIYTSGTTGMPKPAVLKHAKIFGAGKAFGLNFGISPEDVIYNSGLPLYHSAATNIGCGLCLVTGCTLVIRRKFSASMFFEDCVKYKCTVVQYIGELCRYLLGSEPSKFERQHRVRIAVGNGLPPSIWNEFQERFRIPEIGEFYGSSEGNLSLMNWSRDAASRGAIGHMGPIMRLLGFCTIIKYDADNETPVRDPVTGFCIEAADGEEGEAIAEIKDRPAGGFDGYYGDEEQTNKKILTNVFKKGDRYFRSGDLLKKDARGYYFFVDRIGDTFRWKAENVSTTEVNGIVGRVPGVVSSAVYGVQIPNKDGRACCAACVVDRDSFDLAALAATCRKELPKYAQPLFIRILEELQTTGTMKIQTVGLKKEGVDPSTVSDELYFWDADQDKYVPLDMSVWNTIVTGKSRL